MDEMNMNGNEELSLDSLQQDVAEGEEKTTLTPEELKEAEVPTETTMNQNQEYLLKFSQNFSKDFVISPTMFGMTAQDYKSMKETQSVKIAQQKAQAQKEINTRKLTNN